MKNFFNKIKSYSFWVSLSGAIIVLLNAFGNAFGFEIENKVVEDCVMSVASLLVVLGVVANGKNKAENSNQQQNEDVKIENPSEEQVKIDENLKEENNEFQSDKNMDEIRESDDLKSE